MSGYFNLETFMKCYPLFVLYIIYILIYIYVGFYYPYYFKVMWTNLPIICINIINFIISSLIFYSLCNNYGGKHLTALIIIIYPIIMFVLYLYLKSKEEKYLKEYIEYTT